ncbi:hypothetical protein LTR94_024261 [Friedmanniomyces endolithicus]|nr:hypothetical protein LTR94_024261 [Friedmanniomyces endolithicus]
MACGKVAEKVVGAEDSMALSAGVVATPLAGACMAAWSCADMPACDWLWAWAADRGARAARAARGATNYCLGGMVMPSIFDMSWPAIGSAGGGVGSGAGAGRGAGRGADALGGAAGVDAAGAGVAACGGVDSGVAAGTASIGAIAEASGVGSASTG